MANSGRQRPGALKDRWLILLTAAPQSKPVLTTVFPAFYIKFNFMEVTEVTEMGAFVCYRSCY